MIKFINYLPSYVCGNIFTINDYYKEISKYTKCNFFCLLDSENLLYVLHNLETKENDYLISIGKFLLQYFPRGIKTLKDANFESDNDDTIITTLWCLYIGRIKIKNHIKKLILLDCLDFYTCYIDGNLYNFFYELSNICDDIYILVNPFNMNICKNILKTIKNIHICEYYNKISYDRLIKNNSLKNNDKVLTKSNYLNNFYDNTHLYNNNIEFINTLSFNRFAYCRHYKIKDEKGNEIYIENTGKILLEYLALGKNVDYYPINKCIDDGMHYYLKNVGVDDNKEYKDLKVDNKLIHNKVLFNSNDFIFDVLK